MTKITAISELLPAAKPDFMADIKGLLKNFKEGMELLKEFKGLNEPEKPVGKPLALMEPAPAKTLPPKPSLSLPQILQVLSTLGYGDKTLAELVKEFGGLTVKEARELLKNAGA